MRSVRAFAVIVVLLLLAPAMLAQVSPILVTKEKGGSVKTELSSTISVNDKSSLEREFIFVHDSSLPADVVGTPGIRTTFVPDRARGSYEYRSQVVVKPNEAITAVECRFIVFDIWGNHVRTLNMTEVEDIPAGQLRVFTPSWNVFSENEVGAHYASLGYVSRVRTATGRVVEMDPTPILTEARRFAKKFTAADLEPMKDKK